MTNRLLSALALSVALGVGMANHLRAAIGDDLYANLDLFGDALSIVQNHYVREVPVQDLIYSAIDGMVTDLDAHSSFLPPRDFQEMQVETQGEFGGIGIEITIRDEWLTVVAPIEDTPAWNAGLEAADRIIAIEGKSTQGKSLMFAVEQLRGKIGTKVTITVVRPLSDGLPPEGAEDVTAPIEWSEPFDVELIRDKIRVKSVKSKRLADDSILYVKLTQFQARTGADLRKVLAEEAVNQKAGLVLDLRNNPGGLLDQAIEVADIFLQDGKIVYTEGRDPNMHKEWTAQRDGANAVTVPIAVLVNGGTASASEIVAGALQDHRAAVVIGSRSFGKGSVQTILRLRDGSGIRVTTALYYTPNGRSIQAEGIMPDIKVDQPDLEDFVRREEDLEGHLELGENGPEVNGAKPEDELSVPERIKRRQEAVMRLREREGDPVLDRAVDLLQSLDVFEAVRSGQAPPATGATNAPTTAPAAAPAGP